MKKYIYIIALFIITLSACEKDEVIGGTAVQDMSGEWWVQFEDGGDYYSIFTFNTSDNSSSQMWLDLSGFWAGANQQVKAKVNVNVTDKTFSASNVANEDTTYPITFTVTNGRITTNGTIGPVSNAQTDAITLDVEFSDDPGTIYHLNGYHRTKFPGDDH